MRFDVNVSLSAEPGVLGTRTETKNLNSFKSVEKAAAYEIKRQAELLDKGHKIVQETRGWDDAKQKTLSQRGKEEAHDYRYMPEPDVPPVELTDAYLDAIKVEMPIMPDAWRKRLEDVGLSHDYIETLLEAEVDESGYSYLPLIEENLDEKEKAKSLANWFVNIEIPLHRDGNSSNEIKDSARTLIYDELYKLVKEGKLSSTNSKILLSDLLRLGVVPQHLEKYAEEQGYIQVSNEDEISGIIDEVIKENPQAAEDIRLGEMKAIGFMVGQVMKKSHGKANPPLVQSLLKKKLG